MGSCPRETMPADTGHTHHESSWTGYKMGRAPAQLIVRESDKGILQIAGLLSSSRGGGEVLPWYMEVWG